jgi:hypothetical protein
MLEQDAYEGLRDLIHRSIKYYVHGIESCIVVFVTLFNAELNLCKVEFLLY